MSSSLILLATLIALAAAVPSAPVHAASCVGFSDVDTTSTFCKNVEWMKNRAITLGCGDGSTYCPNDAVTRLAMAAFFNRMGNVLAPQYIHNSCSATIASGSAVVCTTADVPAVGYPRKFVMDGFVHGNGGVNQAGASMYLVTEASFNGGVNWASITLSDPSFYLPGSGPILGVGIDLPANLPIRLRYTATLFSATNTFVNLVSRIRIDNGKSVSPPY